MDFKIKFRPFRLADAKFINDLRRIESMERAIGGNLRPVAYERDLKWVEDLVLQDRQDAIYFAITLPDSDDIIGYISISEIDYRNGKCTFSGIKLAEKHAGKGLGKEATLKLIQYVFEELRMERCQAECLENHEASAKMMLGAGYKKEGLMRRAVYKNGVYNNVWLFSMIREDYLEIKKKFEL